jgi:hypothetical protein
LLGPLVYLLSFLDSYLKKEKKEKRREPPKKTAWEKAFYLVVKDVLEVRGKKKRES